MEKDKERNIIEIPIVYFPEKENEPIQIFWYPVKLGYKRIEVYIPYTK